MNERSECKPDRAQPSSNERSECKPDRAQPSLNDDPLDGLDKRLNRSSLVVTLVVVPIVFFTYSAKAALSVAAGACLSYINFHWLKQAVDFVVWQGAQGNTAPRVMARFVGRYALIGLFL